MSKGNNKIKHKDLIMKKAMEVFSEDGIAALGIKGKVKEVGSTEIVVLEAKNFSMDYNFLMEDDTYLHFEFQTTNKKEDDLRRFRMYESFLSLQKGKDVITYVIYSNDIKNTDSVLKTGINKYKVRPIYLGERDGDIIIEDLERKLKNKESITKQELVSLTLTPVMGGKLSKSEKIIKSIRIIKETESEYKYDIESMLYAFADKFLTEKDLEKVKEEISMTELGRMLMEDGFNKGKAEGKTEGKVEILIKQLTKKFGILSKEYKSKIENLSSDAIDVILIDIFEITSLSELDKYFKDK